MLGTLAVILVFGGLIFFHELGHFLVARFFSIGVKTFSLGFGPTLFSFQGRQTRYQVAALPLGGFVSLVGESSDADLPEGFTKKDSFALRPAWQRFCVILAGPVFNLALAWFICWGLMWTNGRTFVPPVVGDIVVDSPAAASPLQTGDRIMTIDGTRIDKFTEMPLIVQRSQGKDLVITAKRPDGDMLTFTLTPKEMTRKGADGKDVTAWGIGITNGDAEHQSFGFFEAATEGMHEARKMVRITWNALSDLVTRNVAFENVGGPILIAQTIYKQADYGIVSVLLLGAFISVNLGVLNLLPVPVLDGGHLVFLAVEMVVRRPVPVALQEKAMIFGVFLLISLMIAATFNDVMRLFS